MAARILIVEDDPDIAELVARYLDKAGFASERAASGREALGAIAAVLDPDLDREEFHPGPRPGRRVQGEPAPGDLQDHGGQAFAAELEKLGVEHTLELFDGKHGGITYRYPGAIRELVLALR